MNSSAQKYIFYLHGAVLEGQSTSAQGAIFEQYRYTDIIESFRKEDFTVVSEVRKSNLAISSYAQKVANEINELLGKGVKPTDITVIGGSKGAVIAMHVSSLLKNNEINYVFLAACNDGNFQSYPQLRFYGNILSIYEESDDIGSSCIRFKNRSGDTIRNYKELVLHTGMGHQFLWKPLDEWMKASMDWANGKHQ